MKLYYYKAVHGNFGDDLNPWLWNQLLPGFFDDDDSEVFVGIGTLLNHRLPKEPVKHVFGSGCGYGQLPDVSQKFMIHAVRGYETARLLGLDRRLVITDAAVLLRSASFARAQSRAFKFGFIPHHQSSRYFGWESVCDELGYHYISAEWDVEKVLFEMSRCETLICEAMHGAIAADALRIPWIPVSCYDYISEFKWRDWLSTVGLPYEPGRVTSLYDIERFSSLKVRVKNAAKRRLREVGLWSNSWTIPPEKATGVREFQQAVLELSGAARTDPLLSDDRVLQRHVDRYHELLDRLRTGRRQSASAVGSAQISP